MQPPVLANGLAHCLASDHVGKRSLTRSVYASTHNNNYALDKMPEKHVDSGGYELQSLLGKPDKLAKAPTATATVNGNSKTHRLDSLPQDKVATTHAIVPPTTSQVSVTGMHCSSCSTAVERALK